MKSRTVFGAWPLGVVREARTDLSRRLLVVAVSPTSGKLVHSAVYRPKGFKSAEAIKFLQDLTAAVPDARVIHIVWDNVHGKRYNSVEHLAAALADYQGILSPSRTRCSAR